MAQRLSRRELHELGCRLLKRSTSRKEAGNDIGEQRKGHFDGGIGIAEAEETMGFILYASDGSVRGRKFTDPSST